MATGAAAPAPVLAAGVVQVGGMGHDDLLADSAALTHNLVLSCMLPGGSLAVAAWMGAAWLRHRRSNT
jgi:hypothetical protein